MRTLLAVLLTAGLAAAVAADDPPKKDPPQGTAPKAADAKALPTDEKKKEPSLAVGDPAPKLKATKWLQGSEVTDFAPGKTYVVEFWATWCGPCIVMMPHMAEMQREYKDKGVTFIGFTKKDPNNTPEKVAEFVQKRGPKLGYTFAYADDSDTYDAYMKAAKQGGIPCSYVVNKEGKIDYIGHPMFLGVVLPKVVEGKWTKDDVAGLAKVEKDVDAVFEAFQKPDAEAGLKALSDFEKQYPALAHVPYFVGPKLQLLLKAKKYDVAKADAEKVIARAVKQDDPMMLQMVSRSLQSPAAKDHKELVKLAVEAAESAVKVAGDKDPMSLYAAAQAHFTAGDKEKAREYGKKAIAAADGRLKTALEKAVAQFDEEKKEEKKDK
jgi:thiol-disulfide isomerase/thioredoxin